MREEESRGEKRKKREIERREERTGETNEFLRFPILLRNFKINIPFIPCFISRIL